jgi:hypothetical protein
MSNDEPIDQPAPSAEQSATTTAPDAPLDLTRAVWQLRVMVCGLGAALFVCSAAFNVFVWKQNRNITSQTNTRATQIARLQSTQQHLVPAVNEIARYSLEKPELTAVFSRFGISVPTTTNAIGTGTSSALPSLDK